MLSSSTSNRQAKKSGPGSSKKVYDKSKAAGITDNSETLLAINASNTSSIEKNQVNYGVADYRDSYDTNNFSKGPMASNPQSYAIEVSDQMLSYTMQLNQELRKVKADPSIHKLQLGANTRMSFGSKEIIRTRSANNRTDSNIDARSTDLLMSHNLHEVGFGSQLQEPLMAT